MTDTTVKLTSVQEDYLAIIYKEECEMGQARGCSIADDAGVTRATVAATLRALKAKGLISYDPYGPISLTQEGHALAQEIMHKRDVLQCFFEEVMALGKPMAQKIAGELAHVVDHDVTHRFERFNHFFAVHGIDFGFKDR